MIRQRGRHVARHGRGMARHGEGPVRRGKGVVERWQGAVRRGKGSFREYGAWLGVSQVPGEECAKGDADRTTRAYSTAPALCLVLQCD